MDEIEHSVEAILHTAIERALGVMIHEPVARAAISALHDGGWRIVPVEPTEEMIKAWRDVFQPWPYENTAYRAMLAAAPNAQKPDDVSATGPVTGA